MMLPALDYDATSTHDALLAELEKCRKRERHLHTHYLAAVNAGDLKKADTAEHAYLTSTAVRFVALVQGTTGLPPSIRPNIQECKELAPALKLYGSVTEAVKVFAIPKSDGGFRTVSSFGPMHRAAQWMVRRLMQPHIHPQSWQYDFKGIHCAAEDIIKVLKKQPTLFAWRGDIKSFYPSFDYDKLVDQAPLPKPVTAYAVLGRHMKVVNGSHGTHYMSPTISSPILLLAARRGIPQGSSASPLIAAWALSALNLKAPTGVHLFNYADDFLLLGPSEDAVNAAAHALAEAVAEAPGGQFLLVAKEHGPAEHGFAFLGHRFWASPSKVEVWPTALNHTTFDQRQERLRERAQRRASQYATMGGAHRKVAALETIADYRSYVRSWADAFRAYDPFIEVGDMEEYVSSFLDWCGATTVDLEPYKASAETWHWQGSGG